jgi:hypothetical protein
MLRSNETPRAVNRSNVPDSGLDRPGSIIRKAMLVLVVITSGVAAVCSRGRRRAFWSAFFATMLLLSVNVHVLNSYYCHLDFLSLTRYFANSLASSGGLSEQIRLMLFWALWQGLLIGFATLAGVFATWVYDQSRKPDEA